MPKTKLVETAAALIHRQGWNATGINQILGESAVPKGSFYYYFHSKDDLGAAIVSYHGQKAKDAYAQTLLNEQLTGAEALRDIFNERIERQRKGDWTLGCPIGNFSNEVAGSIEKIAKVCREVMQDWLAALQIAVERGQRDGSIGSKMPASILARRIGYSWQGALVYMKALQNEQPLKEFLQALEDQLQGA